VRAVVSRTVVSLFLAAPGLLAQFAWKELPGGRLELSENGSPVMVVNHGEQYAEGAPEHLRRCCYVHPLHTPGGVQVTDDFPPDHYHHRGVFWGWPQVKTSGGEYDVWHLRGIGKKLERVEKRGANTVVMTALWVAGDKTHVRETATFTAHPARGGARDLDAKVVLEALSGPVTLAGSPAQGKSYGGLNVRFAPRTSTAIRTSEGELRRDEDLVPHAWAEMEGTFEGKRARLRVTPDPRNPGEPNVWCLRFYGFIGPSFPGVKPWTVEPGKPLELAYRITVADIE
jgi:hypothetical protein